MAYKWKILKIPRLYGLDLKTNIVDVKDGFSLSCLNVFQNRSGIASKRAGNTVMFDADETLTSRIDEIGSATLAGTKYYFKFVGGSFKYSTSITGATTTITPTPAISTTNQIFWAVLNDKLFFVDGTNSLRFFNGSTITASIIYSRPTAAPTSTSGAGTFTYFYTVNNSLGESASSPLLTSIISAATIRVPGATGPQTLVAGDIVKVYSRPDALSTASRAVATYTWTGADVTAGFSDIGTTALNDDQVQYFAELGVALNYSAPSALAGIDVHYGRLVGWKGDFVYNSKISNPHSWPNDTANKEAFVYGVGRGDGESIQRCISFRESLVVFKKVNFYMFGGIGPDDTGGNSYSYRRIESNGIGCVAPKSTVIVGDQGELHLVFLSKQGFMATSGDAPLRIGERVETNLFNLSDSVYQNAVAIHHKREGIYLCSVGSDSARTIWVLDVRKDKDKDGNEILTGWFKWSDINITCMHWDEDKYLFGTSSGFCASERNTLTASDFSDTLVLYFAPADVNTGTDVITVTNTFTTGDAVKIRTTGTIPAPLIANTTYYVIAVSGTQIKLATSQANALLGTAIDLTTTGSGTHSIVGSKAINAFYTTNWINFKTPTYVKKLAKPAPILNALANNVSITITTAVDWLDVFSDSNTITITSSHLWGASLWGSFIWGETAVAASKNIAISRRKVRSIRYKFSNNTINQDFDLIGFEQPYDYIRNRGNFA